MWRLGTGTYDLPCRGLGPNPLLLRAEEVVKCLRGARYDSNWKYNVGEVSLTHHTKNAMFFTIFLTPIQQAFQLPASADAIFQVWPCGREETAAGRVRTCACKAHSLARGETPGWRWDSSAPEASEGGPCVCVTCEVEVSLTAVCIPRITRCLRSRQGQPCRPTRTASSGHAPSRRRSCAPASAERTRARRSAV